MNDIHDTLVAELYRENVLDELLAETDEAVAARTRLREVISLMEQTLATVYAMNSQGK